MDLDAGLGAVALVNEVGTLVQVTVAEEEEVKLSVAVISFDITRGAVVERLVLHSALKKAGKV